jgi:prepilin-type N-terminal cleavage/methylation domain-containing protein
MSEKTTYGFTLIELLVVIAVVGVLTGAVIVLINPSKQLARSRDAGRRSALSQLQRAIERYNVVFGTYPPASSGGGWRTYIQGGCSGTVYSDLTNFGDLSSIPDDPLASSGYHYYYYKINNTKYQLAAYLEDIQASDANYGTVAAGACAPGGISQPYTVLNWVYTSP